MIVSTPKQTAKNLREHLKLPEGHVDLALVCKKLHIRQSRSDTHSNRLGTPCFICPKPGGFVIIWAKDTLRMAQGKRRFIIAHEIGHTFFYPNRSENGTPRRRFPDDTPNLAEERWCDAFARHLLADDPGIKKIVQYEGKKRAFREEHPNLSRRADRQIRKLIREGKQRT